MKTTGIADENAGSRVEATRDLPYVAESQNFILSPARIESSRSAPPVSDSALAVFSKDRIYRYALWRDTQNLFAEHPGYLNWVMLNPSTADERADDPTIRRVIDYTERWGYSRLCVTNLFAYRSADVRRMLRARDPMGADNNMWIAKIAADAARVVVAWGLHGVHQERAQEVLQMLPTIYCLRQNSDFSPVHPLYQKKELQMRPFKRP